MESPKPASTGFGSFLSVIGAVVVGVFGLFIVVAAISAVVLSLDRAPQTAPGAIHAGTGNDAGTAASASYVFSGMTRLGDFMALHLEMRGGGGRKIASYSGYDFGRTVNYLLVSTETGEGHWLWQPPLPVVLNEYAMNQHDDKVLDNRTHGILALIAEKDTNGDNALNGEDLQTLIAIKPDGKTVVRLIERVGRIDTFTLLDARRALLVYEKDGKSWSATYLPESYALKSERELPALAVP